jgi:hypothetical protein
MPCDDIFGYDLVNLETDDCGALSAVFCTGIFPADFFDYSVFVNGQDVPNPHAEFIGCDYDTLMRYSYFMIPGFGNEGPYEVSSWMIGDEVFFKDTFNTIQELVDFMNQVDPAGNWMLDEMSLTITGGVNGRHYGDIRIVQLSTGAMANLEINMQMIPGAVGIALDSGDYELVIVHNPTQCSDTVRVIVECTDDDDITPGTRDTVNIEIYIGDGDLLCFSDVDEIFNDCPDQSGDYVDFFIDQNSNCLIYRGVDIGCETACVITCTQGVCDTTIVNVCVIPRTIDTIYVELEVGEDDVVCLDLSELSGTLGSVTNFCADHGTDAAEFEIDEVNGCISILAEETGEDIACIEFCDDLGNCDTTYIFVYVVQGIVELPPIAVDDETSMIAGENQEIDVLENDTLNGVLRDIHVLEAPEQGDLPHLCYR